MSEIQKTTEQKTGDSKKWCGGCGAVLDASAHSCHNCEGANKVTLSQRRWLITLILTVGLGFMGGHRFYLNKLGTGFLYMATLGLFGIGVLVDIVLILTGHFTDKKGFPLIRM